MVTDVVVIGGGLAGTSAAIHLARLGHQAVALAQVAVVLAAAGVIAAGLLVATVTGLASWLFGYPFLTSTFTHGHWPLLGEF